MSKCFRCGYVWEGLKNKVKCPYCAKYTISSKSFVFEDEPDCDLYVLKKNIEELKVKAKAVSKIQYESHYDDYDRY